MEFAAVTLNKAVVESGSMLSQLRIAALNAQGEPGPGVS
ncbi:hypothetical protein B0G77_2642 [Paraburkholderia sp. BL10I2N1]|nr:hypothetical protein B0G77_2642 [Paraburkholderia sp. BL10I2N1]